MEANLPSDVQNLMLLREMVREARESGSWIVDKLPEAPIDVPGVDDKNNRFDWYQVTDAEGRVGYLHAPKGVQL